MKRKGILTVISGFSGAGKGTVMKRLLEKYPEEYALSISCTSRSPRPGEQDGREYFFKTNEEFEQMIAEDAFLEHAKYVDHYYGTPAAYVKEQMDAGRNVILEIELQGALQIRNKLPETILMFLMPPSADELENRLRAAFEAWSRGEAFPLCYSRARVEAVTERRIRLRPTGRTAEPEG